MPFIKNLHTPYERDDAIILGDGLNDYIINYGVIGYVRGVAL